MSTNLQPLNRCLNDDYLPSIHYEFSRQQQDCLNGGRHLVDTLRKVTSYLPECPSHRSTEIYRQKEVVGSTGILLRIDKFNFDKDYDEASTKLDMIRQRFQNGMKTAGNKEAAQVLKQAQLL